MRLTDVIDRVFLGHGPYPSRMHLNLSHTVCRCQLAPFPLYGSLLVSILCPSVAHLLLSLTVFRGKQRWKEVEGVSLFICWLFFMAINPLCCYGLGYNATDLKPQASRHNQSTSRRNVPRQKMNERWAKDRDGKPKIFGGKIKNCHVLHSGWEHLFKTKGCFCLLCQLFLHVCFSVQVLQQWEDQWWATCQKSLAHTRIHTHSVTVFSELHILQDR